MISALPNSCKGFANGRIARAIRNIGRGLSEDPAIRESARTQVTSELRTIRDFRTILEGLKGEQKEKRSQYVRIIKEIAANIRKAIKTNAITRQEVKGLMRRVFAPVLEQRKVYKSFAGKVLHKAARLIPGGRFVLNAVARHNTANDIVAMKTLLKSNKERTCPLHMSPTANKYTYGPRIHDRIQRGDIRGSEVGQISKSPRVRDRVEARLAKLRAANVRTQKIVLDSSYEV